MEPVARDLVVSGVGLATMFGLITVFYMLGLQPTDFFYQGF